MNSRIKELFQDLKLNCYKQAKPTSKKNIWVSAETFCFSDKKIIALFQTWVYTKLGLLGIPFLHKTLMKKRYLSFTYFIVHIINEMNESFNG